MDLSTFLSALLAIVVIDLVLAGDNAIVIALAARNLPACQRKAAIFWGAFGAVAVRSVMTLAVVWLLKIPGLLAVGGLLLVWIAWNLLKPQVDEADAGSHVAAASFWAAMKTIVIADALMGLDNVLAVAGAAHGNYLLVVLGLLISVPIVVWGSTLVLRLVERFPVVVYVGAAVLVATAVKMVRAEPVLQTALQAWQTAGLLLYAAVPALLVAAFLRNHRQLDSRIRARLVTMRRPQPVRAADPDHSEGEPAMLNVLVPVDGSPNSLKALRHAINEYRHDHDLRLHLLHVRTPLTHHVARFLGGADRHAWHAQQAEAALAPARRLLTGADVPHTTEWHLGDRAELIVKTAKRLNCHHIVMGTARQNSLTRMLQDSVTDRVLQATTVPVEVVVGEARSPLERLGLGAGVGATVSGLVWLALD